MNAIERIRRLACMDQTEFAKSIGVSRTTISAWENGKKRPNPQRLKILKSFCEKHDIKWEI